MGKCLLTLCERVIHKKHTKSFYFDWTVPKYRSNSVYTSNYKRHHTVQYEGRHSAIKAIKINTLFDTGAMKNVMSLEMYKKLKLDDLNTTSIPHVVGASGESLGARGKTKCEININGRLFYQTFIVCKHLKRPIILGRDFSIQNA